MMRPPLVASLVGKIIAVGLWARAPWLAAGFFFGPDLYLLYGLLAPSGQALGRVVTRFATDRREVWLTIDDGPDEADTPRILDLLDRHRARATFFVIGERAARHPGLVREIIRRGHGVGHHTHTHPLYTFWYAVPSRVRRELDDGLAALRKAGAQPSWFRSPVGIKNFFLHQELAKRGLACVGWSVRSGDCVQQDPDRIVVHVMKRIKPGAIVLMHEGPSVLPSVRVEAIARLLAALDVQGFACVVPDAGQLR
jgi:peptidoglycan-N-acetylglucosamine deacetylase